MTPLNTGLALVIYAVFCMIFESGITNKKVKEFIEVSGGVSIMLLFADLIWAAFYYINF